MVSSCRYPSFGHASPAAHHCRCYPCDRVCRDACDLLSTSCAISLHHRRSVAYWHRFRPNRTHIRLDDHGLRSSCVTRAVVRRTTVHFSFFLCTLVVSAASPLCSCAVRLRDECVPLLGASWMRHVPPLVSGANSFPPRQCDARAIRGTELATTNPDTDSLRR